MGLFGKKEEKKESILPELPKLPELPHLPPLKAPEKVIQKSELPPLPSLPSDAAGIEAIKSNVSFPSLNPVGKEEEKRTVEVSDYRAAYKKPVSSGNGQIFIKLDKFKEASHGFETIKAKVHELETMVKKLREVKNKEEQELGAWESEMQTIKTKIEAIDHSLFNKLGEY